MIVVFDADIAIFAVVDSFWGEQFADVTIAMFYIYLRSFWFIVLFRVVDTRISKEGS